MARNCRSSAFAVSAALLTAFAIAAGAWADSLVVGAAADNTMYSEDANQSNGAGNSFFAGRTNNAELRRGLIRFDLSAIPPGSTVTGVTLTLYQSRSQGGTENVRLYRALVSWGEGTSHAPGEEGGGATASPGDATWKYRFFNTNAWNTSGGEFVATASATASVGGQNGFYTWSSAGLLADVQGWVDAPTNNHGWVVRGNEAANRTSKRFESRQSNNTNQRPQLTVVFTPYTGPEGACCFPDGDCQILSSAGCASAGGSYQGDGALCDPNPCPQPAGACCLPGGGCSEVTPMECIALGGSWQGPDVPCVPDPCAPPVGACCFDDGTCLELPQTDCVSQAGTYHGDGSVCAPDLCPLVLTPYLDPLPIPPLATPTSGVPGGAATYDMHVAQVQQQLHAELAPTTLWTYGGTYPGPTILATRDVPITVNWINDLPPGQHYLPVDLCAHGATNEPKIVTHLHGGHVPAAVDGYPEHTFLPGNAVAYVYPNNQPSALIWYHDHALGITRLNVYMGMAGGYVITDAVEQSLNLPSGDFDVPLIIQDRSFHPDGTLKYPAEWQEHFFGDKMLVNGRIWPFLNVRQGKYRFRILNGCNSRTLTLSLSSGQSFEQIGTDGGLLPAPVTVPHITLGPAERADVIVDFAAHPAGTEILLSNSAPAPYPGGNPMHDLPEVMKLVVVDQAGHTDPVPPVLTELETLDPADAVQTRDFTLKKFSDPCAGSKWLINGMHWDHIMEYPVLGTTEIWRFINDSGISHPMHMHLVFFQVLDRQDFVIINGEVVPVGDPVPPAANEAGWKDTVMAHPNQITRVIARFEDYTGRYPYHCHILEHEDHEMMRQFEVLCPPIAFSQQPQSSSAGLGCSATFSVEATSGLLDVQFQWRRNGQDLSDGPGVSGSTTPGLTISNVALASVASYDCVVTTDCASATSAAAWLAVCYGDLNCSGTVDLSDLSTLLSNYGLQSGATPAQGDCNEDGAIDLSDLATLLVNFGVNCP